ncbi:DUF2326 domain-containing protein [Mesobaculum littorinae]|uniref:DUF2326 domain-containing protein n=1 Tax=Mesobaculum littorinae TaxID=2486419 RepID=A0A438ACY9_9RHOB|nr:DUF2326 domain-containing protein [Mesobaculum littorinae]RVV96522.1 DUF2326 domain-containing protein [Mesobaculum littorinae]
MITEVSSDLETFKPLRFGPGLNILLAERHKKSGDRDTRNGTGKTSFIELVHFVLSDKRNGGDDFHKPDLIGSNFVCRFSDHGNEYEISRKSGPADETRKDGVLVSPSDLRKELAQKWFGLNSEVLSEKYAPKFGALLSYFIRKERNGGFANPTLNASTQSGWDSQVCLSYLLGFDWRLPQQLQVKKDQKKDADTLYKMIKSGYLSDGELDLNKMQARLDFLDREVERKRDEIASAQVVDGYREQEATANDLTAQIRSLNEANLSDLDLIESIDTAISEVADANVAGVKSLYHQAGVFFGDQVRKRLEQVEEFHNKVAQNRSSHLRREKQLAQQRLSDRRNEILRIQGALSEKLSLLRSGIAIERLTYLQSELNGLEAEQADLRQQIPRFRNVSDDRRRLKRDIDDLIDAIGDDVLEREDQRRSALNIFASTSQYLYDEPGSLIIGRSKGVGGMSIETDIVGKKSGGKTHMQVFCFDWLLAEASQRQDRFPGFVIHDSHVFDGVDGRQIRLALELAQKKCVDLGIQYIVAMNSDDLDKIEWDTDHFDPRDFVLDTVLTDEPDGGLFGIRF